MKSYDLYFVLQNIWKDWVHKQEKYIFKGKQQTYYGVNFCFRISSVFLYTSVASISLFVI